VRAEPLLGRVEVEAGVPLLGDGQLRPGSAALLALAVLALLLGIISGPENGWASGPTAGGLAAAVLLFACWVVTEQPAP
jgi:hypothetical protein